MRLTASLPVFNGFQREVRTRMLGAVAHVQVSGLGELQGKITGEKRFGIG